MMMDRTPSEIDKRRLLEQQSTQHYEPLQSPAARGHVSRSLSYSGVTPQTAFPSENIPTVLPGQKETASYVLPTPKSEGSSYGGLGISIQQAQQAEQTQSNLLPSPDSPFVLARYGTSQPVTPSFPTIRSTSPASSVWSASASDHGASATTNLSGFIPRLHK